MVRRSIHTGEDTHAVGSFPVSVLWIAIRLFVRPNVFAFNCRL